MDGRSDDDDDDDEDDELEWLDAVNLKETWLV